MRFFLVEAELEQKPTLSYTSSGTFLKALNQLHLALISIDTQGFLCLAFVHKESLSRDGMSETLF
jgi:hypothetical protein